MKLIDTHTHLYLNHFNDDRNEVVNRSLENNITHLLLPNINSGTLPQMLDMSKKFPETCFPMIGLHPASVKEDYEKELMKIENSFKENNFIAIGETGIDLYRDKVYKEQQLAAFEIQVIWAKEKRLPLVIHSRDSFNEIFSILDKYATENITGVFHSFTGNMNELKKALEYDFFIGINGIVTFANSDLYKVIQNLPPEKLLLETDSPYLSPVPKRGRRNESSFLIYIAHTLAEIYGININNIAEITTNNAKTLFSLI